jgi:polysaccharide export outer membrane protein
VGPGDVLQVSVWKNDQLSQKVGVRPDGAITLPLLGDVPVAGKTGGEIATDISQRATKYFNEPPSVTIQISEIKSYRVYVLGEVQRPGEYVPGQQVTVLQALSLGGGFTRFANADQITVVRQDDKGTRRIPFVFSQVIGQGDMRENILLRSGDIVVVP